MKYRKKKPNSPTVYHVGAHRDIASDQRRRRAHSIQRILCLVAVALFVLFRFLPSGRLGAGASKCIGERQN